MTGRAIVFKAPEHVPLGTVEPRVFLAGSIEMGAAENWQTKAEQFLGHLPIVILNPRRDDWDSSWRQSIDDPKFREQVEWELGGLESAEYVLMHFDPATKSPITLLEFGMLVNRAPRGLFVSCPPGFYRRGNLEVVCARYEIRLFDNLTDALLTLDASLKLTCQRRKLLPQAPM
jgi:hypothetical protein